MSDHWFEYHQEGIEPFYHMYNLTHLNERMVELAIARRWLPDQAWHLNSGGLEVGNVMGHYWSMRHTVFDLHEEAAWYQHHQHVISVDLLMLWNVEHPHFPWVVSISTIEHTANPIAAIEILKRLTAPGGKLLVTFPSGADSRLDALIEDGLPGFDRACTMVRYENGHGDWAQSPQPQVREYGPWANSVAICEWEAPA